MRPGGLARAQSLPGHGQRDLGVVPAIYQGDGGQQERRQQQEFQDNRGEAEIGCLAAAQGNKCQHQPDGKKEVMQQAALMNKGEHSEVRHEWSRILTVCREWWDSIVAAGFGGACRKNGFCDLMPP